MKNAVSELAVSSSIERPPGFLLEPFKWAIPDVIAMLRDRPGHLSDLLHLSRTRMHLIGIALAHLESIKIQHFAEILFRGSAEMILDAAIGRRPPGLKRAITVMPNVLMERQSYRMLVELLAEPPAARLLYHTFEIRDSTIRMMNDVPGPLRAALFSLHDTIGDMSSFSEGLRCISLRSGRISFDELVSELARAPAPSQFLAKLKAIVEGLPLPDALPPARMQHATRIDSSHQLAKRDNVADLSARLETLAAKLKSLIRPEVARRIGPDLEALMEAEGIALRPGPRLAIPNTLLEDLRHAILACKTIRLHYRARGTGKLSRQLVCPYGFLYGNRHYLVAYSLSEGISDYRLFSLANIEKIEVQEAPFRRRRDFSLQTFAERSFGVFQEDPLDVRWHFTPQSAPDARQYLFHPTQVFEDQPDGSLVVRFRAGGALEMCWHLFTWGDQVRIIEPKQLRTMQRQQLRKAEEAQRQERRDAEARAEPD